MCHSNAGVIPIQFYSLYNIHMSSLHRCPPDIVFFLIQLSSLHRCPPDIVFILIQVLSLHMSNPYSVFFLIHAVQVLSLHRSFSYSVLFNKTAQKMLPKVKNKSCESYCEFAACWFLYCFLPQWSPSALQNQQNHANIFLCRPHLLNVRKQQ